MKIFSSRLLLYKTSKQHQFASVSALSMFIELIYFCPDIVQYNSVGRINIFNHIKRKKSILLFKHNIEFPFTYLNNNDS